jgi:crotonobetainyl-CoA:carnitine CoA-transferase CaiB-like acyl-CoA transferase
MWTIAGDYSAALVSRMNPPRLSRKTPVNPIWNSYRCADGDWVLLVMPVPMPRYWPRFAKMVGREEWVGQYADLAAIRAATTSLTAEIDAIFASHDRPHWAARLDEHGLIWAPVARLTESIDNPQVRQMGWIAEVEHPVHGRFETLDTPFKIYGTNVGVRGAAPEPGQHTFDVLAEFGVTEDEASELAMSGVIG